MQTSNFTIPRAYSILFVFAFSFFLLCSCNHKKQGINISASYTKSDLKPTIVITNSSGKVVLSENMANGNFSQEINLEKEGFHNVLINYDDVAKTKTNFAIWLGSDDIALAINDDLNEYPIVKTDNKVQTDLSKYYAVFKEESKLAKAELQKAEKFADQLRGDAYNQLYYAIDKAKLKIVNAKLSTLEKISKTDFSPKVLFFLVQNSGELQETQPKKFLAILNSIKNEYKEDDEYKELLFALESKIRVSKGQKLIIKVFGKDINGNTFDPVSLENKKVLLIEFWKSGNTISRKTRQYYKSLYERYAPNGFEIIGISIDKKEDWWRNAIKQDNVSWPQFSDLKGNDSENLSYYNISLFPANILISKEGEILDLNVPIETLGLDLKKYLQ